NIFTRTYPFKAHIDIANAYDGVERLLDDIDLILRSRKATARHLISLNAAALRANAAALRQRVRSPAQRVLSRVRSEEILRPKLWHYKQYASRKVHVPKAYARYKAPDTAPRMAIVTPSFNHVKYLAFTIESVLAQGYPNLSYIVR